MMGGGMIIGAILLILVVSMTASISTAPAAPPPPSPGADICVNVSGAFPQYYADQAPPGSNHFGPAVAVSTAQAENHNRICLDPALFAPQDLYFNDTFTDEAALQQYIVNTGADRAAWLSGVAALEAKMATATVEVVEETATYWTMYAVPRGDGLPPLIQQGQEEMVNQPILKFTFPNGTVKRLKLDCGFQPVEPNAFPGIPPLGSPPPPPPAAPPVVTTVVPPTNPPPTQPPPTTPDGKYVVRCNGQVCVTVVNTTRPPPPPPPPTSAPPSTVVATTLRPTVPDNPECIGGDCDHPSPSSTVAPPVTPPNTQAPVTNPTIPGSG